MVISVGRALQYFRKYVSLNGITYGAQFDLIHKQFRQQLGGNVLVLQLVHFSKELA